MGLFSVKNQKTTEPEPMIIRDFDKLIAEPVAFKLHGRVHRVNPITVQEFWKFSEAMIELQRLSQTKDVKIGQLTEGYLLLFRSVCPSIDLSDVEAMTQPQVAALLQFIVDTIKGASQIDEYDAQKKNPQNPVNP